MPTGYILHEEQKGDAARGSHILDSLHSDGLCFERRE